MSFRFSFLGKSHHIRNESKKNIERVKKKTDKKKGKQAEQTNKQRKKKRTLEKCHC